MNQIDSEDTTTLLNEGLTVLSFGGGQDSTALLYKIVKDPDFRLRYVRGCLLVVMSATGDEHPETDMHVRDIMGFCKRNGVEFHHITPDKGFHLSGWRDLIHFYRTKNAIGSKAFAKVCTDQLKIRPIYKFIDHWIGSRTGMPGTRKQAIKAYASKHGKIRVIIGIAAGEESRLGDPSTLADKWMRECVERVYPLIDLKMDRQACQDYIRSISLLVPPPSNCMRCHYMSAIELLWLYRHHPEKYFEWVELEQNKINANIHMGERNLGVNGKKLLPQVLEEAKVKFGHMTDAQLQEYKMSHGHCVKSKY